MRWRCKACLADFSVTSGTLFASHKLSLRSYLLAIAAFCNEVKGKSMLALSRELDVQYKTAFVLAHKLREAMAASMKGARIGGPGCTAEIDGAYFDGHVRPHNLAAERVDRRLTENRSSQRRVVVVMRERGGRTLAVFPAEADALPAIRQRVARDTIVHADESPAWSPLHASFAMQRINHQQGYSIEDACTNQAESFFSRLLRGELGITTILPGGISLAMRRRLLGARILHHSDQGSQYTSEQFQKLMADNGVACSMSRSGNVWDNAAMESFFSSLKTERTARKVYRTRNQARADVFDYIERFYNSQRRHSTIGYVSPCKSHTVPAYDDGCEQQRRARIALGDVPRSIDWATLPLLPLG